MAAWDMVLGPLFKIIDKVVPDKAAADEAKFKLLSMENDKEILLLTQEFSLTQGQVEVNKVEAASDNLFVAGWRPFVGWVCGLGFAVQFVLGPLGAWIASLLGYPFVPPLLDIEGLLTMLGGLLGLGAFRSYEKVKRLGA